ncbi:MAG: L,D-transpeptidase [Cellulosilyticaceae bacterium]
MIKIVLIMMISILFQFNSYSLQKDTAISLNYFEKKIVGKVEKSESQILINGKAYSLYNLQDTLYVPISYLKEIGVRINEVDHKINIELIDEVVTEGGQEAVFENYVAYINNYPVYIGNLKTYSLLVEQDVLVPLDALRILWNISEDMSQYSLELKYYDLDKYIKIEEDKMINQSSHLLRIGYSDIFWDGKECKEIKCESVLLEPGEVLSRGSEKDNKEKIKHLTTVLLDVCGLPNEVNKDNPYGQKNTTLFKIYENVMRLEELDKFFVPYMVTGIVKYPVGPFKEKDQVVVWRGEKRQYYIVVDKDNKKISVPWESLDIIGDLGVKWPQATVKEIEDYVNLKGMSSETEYFVWTDLYRQRTYILKEQEEVWKVEKIMICSTGRNTYLTPRGEFKLEYRIPYFGMGKGFMCKNAVVIFRDYMYHSILFDKTGQYVKEGKCQLGQRVSHGCVRLSEEDSAWIYKHIPLETTVWIN